MKYLLIVIAFFLNTEANAQVYKCKNEKGKITYQSSPCQNETGGKLWIMPGPPIEEQMRQQARIAEEEEKQRLKAEEAQKHYDKRKEEERILAEKKEEEIRRQQAFQLERYKLHLLERQARAAEEAARKSNDSYTRCTNDGFGNLNCHTY